jgi:paraquat-inducible protein B
MTNNASQSNVNSAEVVPRQGISIVWFVPFIALIFGLWLTVKVVSEQGTFITIEFDNGAGIVANKTEVRYKGLITGLVKKVVPSDDLQHVIAEVEMTKDFKEYLTENTRFWLVSADISLKGISGLDTLISGSYINILPDTNDEASSQDHFIALTEAPALDMSTPGLHLTLTTNVLGSINENSPISFKQIPIGYVTGYHYIESTKKIAINIFIEPEHAHLVKENSLFYNTSGVQVTASLSAGLKVNTDSLASIIAGGIAVDTLSYQAEKAQAHNGQMFPLHADFQAAEMGHEIELTLDWNSGVDHNAAILYQGLTIGMIESFSKIDPVARKITAKAKVNPRVAPYLTEKSQFYIVAPRINLTGVSNAKSLLTGAHISMRASLEGKASQQFKVFSTKPPYQYSEPGLHLALEANNRSSLQIGSNVYYKQQLVGNVQAIDTISPEQHLIYLHIQPEFTHYVNRNSRFYNSSGIKIKASLQGVDIQAQSLQSMLTGSITFSSNGSINESEKSSSLEKVTNGDAFPLYMNDKIAKQKTLFTLKTAASTQVNNHTRILYRGIEVGSVHQIDSMGEVKQLQLGLLPEYQYILTEQSQFWLVKPSLSLSGTSDTDALLGGSYITFNAGDGAPQNTFNLLNSPPAKHASATGLQLTLLSHHAKVATPGSAVSYRGITVGQVDNVSLDKKADNIRVNITIDEEHRHLIKNTSRFYNASGLTVSGGFSDFVVKTESIDAILRGGISFYNPQITHSTNGRVAELDSFNLFEHVQQAENAGLSISIHFDDSSGLKAKSKVIYQEQVIGLVERLVFTDKQIGANAMVLLNDLGAKYAKRGAKFWKVEPQIGLVGSKNVTALLDGAFIALLPSTAATSTQQTAFNALALAPTVEQLPYGLNIKLTTQRLGSVRVGNPVLYRQIKVGRVIGVGLSNTADAVNVFINIAQPYSALVKRGSQFWNTSGISIEAGVFSGINIDSESIETLVAGGIAFATPMDHEESGELPKSFTLHTDVDDDWLTWQPKIIINQ